MKVIGTTEAAKRLGISANRVRDLIASGRLKAQKIGREYAINPKDLDAVKNRIPGRPRKAAQKRKEVKAASPAKESRSL
jgi:excisionase family DNA binding protein